MSLCKTKQSISYWDDVELAPPRTSNLMVELNSAKALTESNVWTDSSDLNNSTTLYGGFTKIPIYPNIFGNYISFGGVNGYGTFSSSLNISDQVTITAWIKAPIDPTGTKVLLANRTYQNSGYSFVKYAYGGNALAFTTGNGTTSALVSSQSITWTPDIWYYIAVSYLNPSVNFYLNGLSIGSASMPFIGVTAPAPSNMYLGAFPSLMNYLNYGLSELRVYNIALSSSEIAYDYTHSATYYLTNGIIPI